MPANSPKCLRCGGAMEDGYILDHGHYNTAIQGKWVEGAPETSFWSGLKTKDRKVLAVVTWRCVACGHLESFAA